MVFGNRLGTGENRTDFGLKTHLEGHAMTRINKNGLQVAAEYVDFIENEAPWSGVTADAFWAASLSGA